MFGADKNANGVDTITGFTAGAGGDVFNVAAFLGSGKTIQVADVIANASTATEVTANVIKLAKSDNTSSDKVKFVAAGNYVVLYDDDAATTTNTTKVYYHTATQNSEAAVSDIVTGSKLVAITGVNGVDGFTSDNFIA